LRFIPGPDGQWVEVRDTGPGIRREDRDRIFQPFEQLAAGAGGAGVGLGLSLVKGVVEALGGALRLDSAEGRGSTFRLAFPERGAAAA
jgi:two-component system, sensor histidine kinase